MALMVVLTVAIVTVKKMIKLITTESDRFLNIWLLTIDQVILRTLLAYQPEY